MSNLFDTYKNIVRDTIYERKFMKVKQIENFWKHDQVESINMLQRIQLIP